MGPVELAIMTFIELALSLDAKVVMRPMPFSRWLLRSRSGELGSRGGGGLLGGGLPAGRSGLRPFCLLPGPCTSYTYYYYYTMLNTGI
eukprot:COSAG06_NODE_1406_length_9552_cov_7.866286_7_plen_88_part_00